MFRHQTSPIETGVPGALLRVPRASVLTSAVALLLLFSFSGPLLAQSSIPSLVKKAQPSIVTVIGFDEKGEAQQLGTGFFVDRRGYLVTNRHVLAGAIRAEIRGSSGKTYPIEKVLAVDESGDLIKVLVDIPFFRVRPLRINPASPEPGEHVVVIGSPFGLEQSVSDGIVSTIRDADSFGKLIQITAPISSGSSGSPVLNERGMVIGVATVQLTDGQNLNFAIPSERVLNLKHGEARSFTDWSASTYEKAALKAAAAGQFDASLELYQKAQVLNPDSAEALDGMGMAFFALGKYDDALNAYRKAEAADPARPEVHYHLGESYEKRSDWKSSIASYSEALRLKPDYGAALHRIAMAYLRSGDRNSATANYEALVKVDAEDAKRLAAEMKECCQ